MSYNLIEIVTAEELVTTEKLNGVIIAWSEEGRSDDDDYSVLQINLKHQMSRKEEGS